MVRHHRTNRYAVRPGWPEDAFDMSIGTPEDDMKETSSGSSGQALQPNKLRFTVSGTDDPVESSSGHYLGQMCHNHVLTEVYMQLDDGGAFVAIHTLDVGSC
jgi:hypothetical protein